MPHLQRRLRAAAYWRHLKGIRALRAGRKTPEIRPFSSGFERSPGFLDHLTARGGVKGRVVRLVKEPSPPLSGESDAKLIDAPRVRAAAGG
jgi:hypothetical protein